MLREKLGTEVYFFQHYDPCQGPNSEVPVDDQILIFIKEALDTLALPTCRTDKTQIPWHLAGKPSLTASSNILYLRHCQPTKQRMLEGGYIMAPRKGATRQ